MLLSLNGTRMMFGEYRNVFLTEKEYQQLKTDFSGLDDLIEQLSAYIQSTGRKYAAHACIYDRLLEMCVPISCIGVSLRKENAQEKLERIKLLIG